MSIIFKKTLRSNPFEPAAPGKYYPQLITMGQRMTKEKIIYEIKDKSSLSAGDIESVTTNFIEIVARSLLAGYAVQIPRLGLFSLSAKAEGAETEEACTPRNIRSIHVNFRPAANLRPNLTATRAEDRIEFIDFVTYLKGLSLNGIDMTRTETDGGGTNGGGNVNGGTYIDPNA